MSEANRTHTMGTYSTLINLLASDMFDTRDLVELIEDLTEDAADGDEDAAEDLGRAQRFAEELSAYAEDYDSGAAVIRDSYFVTYAQELADDLGLIPSDLGWPLSCIDWDQAARELQMDYTAVVFEGTTWWVR